MRLYLFILTLIICQISYGQDFILSGKIYSSKNNSPISYASIGISNTHIGTISNNLGDFQMKLTHSQSQDTITISAIGYKSKKIAIPELYHSSNKTIYLESHTYKLNEVIITNKKVSAKDILRLCIKSIPKNYPTKKYSYEVFFREAGILDSTYALLTESVSHVVDYGYQKDIKKNKLQLLEFRKSNDNRKFNWRTSLREWLYEKNGLYECIKNDRLKIKEQNNNIEIKEYYKTIEPGAHRFLCEDFLRQIDANIDSLSYYNNKLVYCISYTSTKGIYKTDSEGQIIVEKSTKAILEIRSRTFTNKDRLRSLRKEDGTPKFKERTIVGMANRGFDGPNHSKIIVKYKKQNNKYYLSYIRVQHSGTVSIGSITGFNNFKKAYQSNWTSNMLYQDNELFVTKVHEKPIRIKWRKKMDRSKELYKHELPYTKSFWDSYTTIVRNPLSQKMASDLSLEKNLEQQFIQNGK
ncbi:carboxypeptidase-like regulatory domain-containing protein [Marinifilum sp. D714]|uniref:carboxypeptidase-like regulatory domain-containing protein n=1 Tax=Marinifilum sp. D714 TaxID=2937523 RepID=UPI0027CCFF9B|nr:carboxypeptidase-like regulatory domain-containing protein [Marinifilum sp. D714]MDQ2180761.1 carboxypeptidase-like regulatory domain-containing protein [Marinifilum sp. D714]